MSKTKIEQDVRKEIGKEIIDCLNPLQDVLSKFESQIWRDPSLPKIYTKIKNEGFKALDRLKKISNNL